MSYDISLWVPRDVDVLDWNYTSNCASMWREAGMHPEHWEDKKAFEVLPEVEQAISTLRAEAEKFLKMNPKNGWGSYDSLLGALEIMAQVMRDNPNGIMSVSH